MPRRPRSATGYIPVGALDLFGDENIDCAQRFIYAVVSFRNGGSRSPFAGTSFSRGLDHPLLPCTADAEILTMAGGGFQNGSATRQRDPPRLNYCFHRLFAWAPSIFFIGGELFDGYPGFFRRASARCKLPF